MTTETEINEWVRIGKKNPWIREAYDPRFDSTQVHEKKTVQELYDHFQHGNWCLGDAPYYHDICFINQVDGGSEYLTIKGNVPFESLSADHYTLEKLQDFIDRVEKATDNQLRKLEY